MKNISLRRYLLAGLVVWLPILATFGILRFIVDLLDQTISLLPKAYQPQQLFGFQIPGFGVLLSLILLLFTGLIATNLLGQKLVSWSEAVLDKIPLVRTIYNTSKQVIQAIFSTNSQAFRKVLLVEFPRKGMWSIAFQTSMAPVILTEHTGTQMLSVFIPTTPNPTSGFLMMVPQADILELEMTIDEALKFIISLGMMQPIDPAAMAVRSKAI
ncbi:MAG: DUF502 domain-containing protein [Legionellales bacterium]|nr:DUF502 domain-containing protein [Legionellales bacterium]